MWEMECVFAANSLEKQESVPIAASADTEEKIKLPPSPFKAHNFFPLRS